MLDDFHNACRLGDVEYILSALPSHQEYLNQIDNKLGWSPLYRSVVSNQVNSVKVLIEQGANANIQNRLGESPLHQAAYNNFIDIAEVLLANGADPNLAQHDGDTPLHLACMRGHLEMAQLLMKYQADPSRPNKVFCKTPVDYAADQCHSHILKVMQQKKIKICTTYIDDSNQSKETNFEPESEKTSRSRLGFPSQLFSWLSKHKLDSVYEQLLINGYEDLNHLISIMHSNHPLTLDMLEKIGILKPGLRMRLLARLEEENSKRPRMSNCRSLKSISWCANVPQSPGVTFSTSIEEFLEGLGLKKLTKKFVDAGLEDYDQILFLMGSKYPVTDEFLEKVIGVEKIGYRHRILAKLNSDAGLRKSRGLAIEKEDLKSACECTIV